MEEENVPVWGFPASNGGIAVCRWREGVVAEEGEEGGTTKGEEGGGNNAKFPSRRKAREQRLSSIIKDKSPFEPRTRSRDLTQPDHFFFFLPFVVNPRNLHLLASSFFPPPSHLSPSAHFIAIFTHPHYRVNLFSFLSLSLSFPSHSLLSSRTSGTPNPVSQDSV